MSRLDAYSTSPITDIEGRKTTPKEWAQRLNVIYRPGVVLFNEGKQRMRMDGMQYHYHFKELLRYVSGRYYREYATFPSYNAARREELLQQGVSNRLFAIGRRQGGEQKSRQLEFE